MEREMLDDACGAVFKSLLEHFDGQPDFAGCIINTCMATAISTVKTLLHEDDHAKCKTLMHEMLDDNL